MLSLLLKIIVLAIIGFPILKFNWEKPDISFWIYLNLYFDPGGYVSGFLGGNIFGRFNITDIIIVGIVFSFIAMKPNFSVIKKNHLFKQFISVLFIYLVYYFFVYGYITPGIHKDLNYPIFLLKNRNIIYGLIILFATYFFSLRNLMYFYSVTLFFGVISLSLYILTIITGVNFVPVVRFARYSGSGMIRIAMTSYGMYYYLFSLSIIVYMLSWIGKLTFKYKKLLYYAGILMTFTMLITLTRRVILDVIGTILLAIMIITYIFRTKKIVAIAKFIVPTLALMIILTLVMPKYIGYISTITQDAFSLVTTGEDTRGISDYRVSGEGPLSDVKRSIRENFWIGNGFSNIQFSGKHNQATSPRGADYAMMADAASEVPIYYTFFGFGFLGAMIILILYFLIAQLFVRILIIIKNWEILAKIQPITLILAFFILLVISKIFTVRLFGFGGDFFYYSFHGMAVILGIGFATYEKLNKENG